MNDMRLQLIIEAFNRTQGAWTELSGQVEKAKAQAFTLYDAYGKPIQALDKVGAAGTAAGGALDDAGKKGGAGMKHVHDQAQHAHSMLGQMVQMAILMGALMGSKKLFNWGMEYNKTLETSKLGIGAIITSMGEVTDAQGNVLQGQAKWNASQSLAVDAQKELQRIAMVTSATYVELVEVYQGILAPALAAKMTFAETLEITGLLTNSVKALGLPMNQIKQEARDLIQGGINAASSSLATALGISDSMVKKWREQGTVFKELKGRLDGFVYASREFSNTWEGAWSNFQDIAQRALGEGSKPLFAFIRGEIIKLSNDMVTITRDASGKIIDIQVKPEVVARIRELADDLRKLIQIMEMAVKWGSKLAEPVMYIAIAVGIGKITAAVQGLATATGAASLARFFKAVPLLAGLVGGWKLGQMEEDNNTAQDIRSQVTATQGHAPRNVDQFGWKQLREVREKLPAATDSQITEMLRQAIISVRPKGTGPIDRFEFTANVDDERAKKYLDGGTSPFGLKGPDKKSEEQLKKELAAAKKARAAAIADLEDSYAQSSGVFKVGETKESEAIKTGLKEKELAYQQGLLSLDEYNQARADLQQQGLKAELKAISDQQAQLTTKYKAEAAQITDPEKLSEKHKAYVSEWYKLEVDKVKKTAELKRAGVDEDLKQFEQRRALEAAERDGALKLLQERLNGEKQLTQLLLDRERITPLEAERRNISTEQRGLEADYWDIFGKKQSAPRDPKIIQALEAQLRVLEERMANLDQATPDRFYKAGKDTASLEAKREEARISHELAQLDEEEKLRTISKAEALIQRKALLEDLVASYEKIQENEPKDTTAWLAAQAAIDGTTQRLLELKLAMRELSDDMAGGLAEGFAEYVDGVGGSFKQMRQLANETAQAMQGSFSDFFFDAMTGKLKSFSDYFKAFISSIARALANVMAQKLVVGMIGGGGGLFHDGGLVMHEGGLVMHDGGLVVPRFHFGGLASDEVPAILQKGERVLDREHNALLERFANKTESTGGISVSLGGITIEGGSNNVDAAQAAEFGRGLKATVTQFIIEQKRPGGLLN